MKATISLLSLIIAAMLLCCGCSKKEQYRIGVSQCSYDDWREKLNDEINRELLTHNEATADIVSAYDNIGKQIDDIQRFIDEDYDIIIASPIEAEALTPIIKEAAAKGIPTIIFDRNINEKCYTAYLGADNALLGKNVGDYLAARMSGEGKIIEKGTARIDSGGGTARRIHEVAGKASGIVVDCNRRRRLDLRESIGSG